MDAKYRTMCEEFFSKDLVAMRSSLRDRGVHNI